MSIYYVVDAKRGEELDQSTYWQTSKNAAVKIARRTFPGWNVTISKIEVSDLNFTGEIISSEVVCTFVPRL